MAGNLLVSLFGILIYTSGLLIWPICALLWRKKRRTRALRWVFLAEAGCLIALLGFAAAFPRMLEHGYYWFILMILVNILFTPVALGAAIYDYSTAHRSNGAVATNKAVCVECNRALDPQNMIQHHGLYVCAQCKPVFLQKLAEGARITPAPARKKS